MQKLNKLNKLATFGFLFTRQKTESKEAAEKLFSCLSNTPVCPLAAIKNHETPRKKIYDRLRAVCENALCVSEEPNATISLSPPALYLLPLHWPPYSTFTSTIRQHRRDVWIPFTTTGTTGGLSAKFANQKRQRRSLCDYKARIRWRLDPRPPPLFHTFLFIYPGEDRLPHLRAGESLRPTRQLGKFSPHSPPPRRRERFATDETNIYMTLSRTRAGPVQAEAGRAPGGRDSPCCRRRPSGDSCSALDVETTCNVQRRRQHCTLRSSASRVSVVRRWPGYSRRCYGPRPAQSGSARKRFAAEPREAAHGRVHSAARATRGGAAQRHPTLRCQGCASLTGIAEATLLPRSRFALEFACAGKRSRDQPAPRRAVYCSPGAGSSPPAVSAAVGADSTHGAPLPEV